MLESSKAFSGFSVDNLDKAKAFYSETLGINAELGDMGLSLRTGNGEPVFVYQKDDHQPATFTVLNFVVDDIDKAVDELTSKGVVFDRYDDMPAPQDPRGILRGRATNDGPDIAWFKDPAGNILSVLQEK